MKFCQLIGDPVNYSPTLISSLHLHWRNKATGILNKRDILETGILWNNLQFQDNFCKIIIIASFTLMRQSNKEQFEDKFSKIYINRFHLHWRNKATGIFKARDILKTKQNNKQQFKENFSKNSYYWISLTLTQQSNGHFGSKIYFRNRDSRKQQVI